MMTNSLPRHAANLVEAIHSHLDNAPVDFQARRELADLLEDAEQIDAARLQRWMAAGGKSPCHVQRWYRRVWTWRLGTGTSRDGAPELAPCIYDLLTKDRRSYAAKSLPTYETRQEAEEDLLRVLNLLEWDVYR